MPALTQDMCLPHRLQRKHWRNYWPELTARHHNGDASHNLFKAVGIVINCLIRTKFTLESKIGGCCDTHVGATRFRQSHGKATYTTSSAVNQHRLTLQ